MRPFCCEKAEFFKYFGLQLDLDWVFKNQDWIWIAKYDNPLISDTLVLKQSSTHCSHRSRRAFDMGGRP